MKVSGCQSSQLFEDFKTAGKLIQGQQKNSFLNIQQVCFH